MGNTEGSRQNSDTFWAYIAGFLDGDGCITIRFEKNKTCKLGYYARVRLSFTQHKNKRKVLDYLCQTVESGVVTEYQHNNMAEYVIYNQRTIEVILIAIEPYIVVKLEHLQLAKQLLSLKHQGYTPDTIRQMFNLYQQIGQLNNYPKTNLLDPVTTCPK